VVVNKIVYMVPYVVAYLVAYIIAYRVANLVAYLIPYLIAYTVTYTFTEAVILYSFPCFFEEMTDNTTQHTTEPIPIRLRFAEQP